MHKQLERQLAFGVNVNWIDPIEHKSLLLWSIIFQQNQVAQLLLAKGANVFLKDGQFGGDALYWSCRSDNPPILKTLLAQVSDPLKSLYTLDKTGQNAIHVASHKGFLGIIESLVNNFKINLNCKTSQGNFPLILAVQSQHWAMAKFLIQNGAKTNPDSDISPLMVCIRHGHHSLVETLLEFGANPKVQDQNGWCPLAQAVSQNDTKMVEILMSFLPRAEDLDTAISSTLNTPFSMGDTPLHIAAFFNNTKIILDLIQAGAQTDLENDAGETFFDVASRRHSSKQLCQLTFLLVTKNLQSMNEQFQDFVETMEEIKDNLELYRH